MAMRTFAIAVFVPQSFDIRSPQDVAYAESTGVQHRLSLDPQAEAQIEYGVEKLDELAALVGPGNSERVKARHQHLDWTKLRDDDRGGQH